jgi:hypothetical protein
LWGKRFIVALKKICIVAPKMPTLTRARGHEVVRVAQKQQEHVLRDVFGSGGRVRHALSEAVAGIYMFFEGHPGIGLFYSPSCGTQSQLPAGMPKDTTPECNRW